MIKPFRQIYGVGIVDVPDEYRVSECKHYRYWWEMLRRCYDPKYLEYRPKYEGCTVCPEWYSFSCFKAWMDTKDWHGKVLDKDILISGNKIYSPETCVFVLPRVNSFLTEIKSNIGKHLTGVNWNKKRRKFLAQCGDGKGRNINIGVFDDPIEAHKAWASKKIELVKSGMLGDLDGAIETALIARYQAYIDNVEATKLNGGA